MWPFVTQSMVSPLLAILSICITICFLFFFFFKTLTKLSSKSCNLLVPFAADTLLIKVLRPVENCMNLPFMLLYLYTVLIGVSKYKKKNWVWQQKWFEQAIYCKQHFDCNSLSISQSKFKTTVKKSPKKQIKKNPQQPLGINKSLKKGSSNWWLHHSCWSHHRLVWACLM